MAGALSSIKRGSALRVVVLVVAQLPGACSQDRWVHAQGLAVCTLVHRYVLPARALRKINHRWRLLLRSAVLAADALLQPGGQQLVCKVLWLRFATLSRSIVPLL